MNGFDILKAVGGADERYIEMSEGYHPRRRKMPRLTKTAIGIAAAVMVLAIPAGALYSQFMHKESVQEYFAEGTAEYLEEQGLALNYTDENEHIRLTVDTLLSDGHNGIMVITIDALDEAGKEFVAERPFVEPWICEDGTDEKQFLHGGGAINEQSSDTQYHQCHELQFDYSDIDFSKKYKVSFVTDETNYRSHAEIDPNDDYSTQWGDSITGEIEFEFDFSPNVETKEFINESGEKLYVSQLGYYTYDTNTISRLKNISSEGNFEDGYIRLYRKGSLLTDRADIISESFDTSPKSTGGYGWFDSIIDIDKYESVKIGKNKFSLAE